MPDPTLRQLLEFSRPIQEFSQAIQTSLRLIQAAVAAEGQVENLKGRAEAAAKELQTLEARRAGVAGEVSREREALLAPVKEELGRLQGDRTTLQRAMAADQAAFDEERGRRTSILKALEEQTQTAQRQHLARLRQQQDESEAEKAKHRTAIEELMARHALVREELAKTQMEYQAVLDAASKLVRRAG